MLSADCVCKNLNDEPDDCEAYNRITYITYVTYDVHAKYKMIETFWNVFDKKAEIINLVSC